jgi:AsmA-like C-terminal region
MADYPRANPAQWWKSTAVGGAHRSPHAMFIGRFRRWTTLLLLLVLTGLVGGVWFMVSPSRMSTMAGILLSHVLGGDVTIASSHLSLDGTLQLTGVKLKTHAGTDPEDILFSADNLQVSFNWLGLLTGHLEATEIDADRPVLNLVQNVDNGHWNYEAFLANRRPGLPTGGAYDQTELPTINLNNAEVRWGRIEHGQYQIVGSSSVNGQLGPSQSMASEYKIEIEQQTPNGAPGITFQGQWNVTEHEFTAQLSNLEFTDELRRSLPEPIQQWWQILHLQGGIEAIGFHIDPINGIQLSAKLRNVSMQLTVPSQKLGPQIIPITGLSGDVTAGNSSLEITNLSGTVMKSRFLVTSAQFDGYQPGDPFNVTLKMPSLNINPQYPALFSTEKFRVATALIYRLRPSGLMDLSVQVSRAKNMPVQVNGQILCRDVRARYVEFPYPFEHAQGVIRFTTREIDFDNLHATAETYPISLNGMVGINQEYGPVNLTIASDHCYFDQRLATCMPEDLLPIWNKFNPKGFGRFICLVTRTAGDPAKPNFTVQVFPVDVTGRYVDFPYPLQHVHGEILFTEHQTKIVNLTSPVAGGKGSIVFTGTVDYSPDAINDMTPRVHVRAINIPVDQTLWNSLPDNYNRRIKPVSLQSGMASLDAMIIRNAEDEPVVDGTLTLSGGVLTPKQLPWPITHAAMLAHLSPGALDILSLTGNLGRDQKGMFNVHAHILVPEQGAAQVDMGGSWSNADIGPAAARDLPENWRNLWNKWNPSGVINGSLQLALSIGDSGSSSGGASGMHIQSLDVKLQPEAMQLAPAFLPGPISNIHGAIDIQPQTIGLEGLTAVAGPMNLQLNGSYDTLSAHTLLSLRAQAPNIPEEWIKVLPGSAATTIGNWDPQGAWLLDMGKLEFSKVDGISNVRFTGSVVIDDFKLQKIVLATARHLTVTVAGNWITGDSVPDMAGVFSLRDLSWAGRTVDPASGEISADSIKNTIDFAPVKGIIAGGTLQGDVNIALGPAPSYKAAFIMTGAELADLLAPASAITPAGPVSSGKVNASLSMSQKFGDPTTRTGAGILEVKQAQIFNVPLAMGLLQITTLRLPISSAFDHARITYNLNGNIVTFNSIELNSPGVDLTGGGTVDLGSRQLSLNMFTQTPSGLDIPVLGDVLNVFQQQLLELRIRGTIDDPAIVPIPLHILTWPVDWMFP